MDATLESRIEELASVIASDAKTIDDVNGVMRLMMKSTLERMLDTEMDVHLGRRSTVVESAESDLGAVPQDASGNPGKSNRRNGHSRKTVQGELGEFGKDGATHPVDNSR